MKKYFISVSAHMGDESKVMKIYDKDMDKPLGFLFREWLRLNFFAIDWQIDDGEDAVGTDYVQYACYPDPDNTDEYLLAVYQEDEKQHYPWNEE